MGYLPGRFAIAVEQKEKRLTFTPGPEEAGGSQEMVAGFRQAIKGSAINTLWISLWGDNI